MRLIGRISACLLLICTVLVSLSSSEWAGGEPNMGSHIMILPGRPYYGVKMSTKTPLIIMVHKKYFANGRYRLECFSAGPKRANNYSQDPQGEFKVVPFVSEEKSSVSQSLLDTLSSRLLPGSLVFVNSELYDSEHRRFKSFSQGGEDFVAFEVTAKLKNVSYSRQIESRDILLNIARVLQVWLPQAAIPSNRIGTTEHCLDSSCLSGVREMETSRHVLKVHI
ncbi:hypothetical protein OJ253_1321 [Cryptosporidium canis]|uniref:Signal peptide-containing protein n=1 Tax=Cryptosporidium canis TaxID=195482 RepID=A0A9D5DJH3_9CRYT|nr:hypothetical protein OJ253_1321 [Cryptosporidium canis]